jgi:hypothetical protein
MEAVGTSETSVYSNETTRRYIPEGSNLDLFSSSGETIRRNQMGQFERASETLRVLKLRDEGDVQGYAYTVEQNQKVLSQSSESNPHPPTLFP